MVKWFWNRFRVDAGSGSGTIIRYAAGMAIKDDLHAQLQDAMRAKDRSRMDALRSIETEVSRARSEPGFSGEVDDDLYVRVIGSYVKKMEKARAEYEQLGERGADQAGKLAFEVEYLSRWLPATLSEDETRAIVRAAIAELGADDPAMAGKVTGAVMKSGRPGLDGKLVNRIVREELTTA
jgi:uncharacterized protein YqeY